MVKNIFLVTISAILLAGCANNTSTVSRYKVNGVWSGGDGETVYIGKTDPKTKVINYIDSANVVDGKFIMTGELTKMDEYDFITKYGKSNVFITDEPFDVTVKVIENSYKNKVIKRANITFGGSDVQRTYQQFVSAQMVGSMGMMAVAFMLPKAKEEGDLKKQDSILNIYISANNEKVRCTDSLFNNHLDTYTAAFIIEKIYVKEKSYEEIEKDFNKLSPRVQKSLIGCQLRETINEVRKSAIGQPAQDFSAQTPDGDIISLSSLKGKYVLIDFWASWCSPCIAEVPNVKRVYDEFKDKGFEILSVSLDDKKDKWINAIDKYELNWLHVSTLKGWGCDIAKAYHITGVPAMLLLDKDGKIVTKDLREDKLREAVSALINNSK